MRHRHPHIAELLKLPRRHRLLHPHARRHIIGITTGIVVMVGGVGVSHGIVITEFIHIPHLILEVCGGLVHAAGAIPVLWHVEPVWRIIAPPIDEHSKRRLKEQRKAKQLAASTVDDDPQI